MVKDSSRNGTRRLLIASLIALWALLSIAILLFFRWSAARDHAARDAHAEALPIYMPAPEFALTNRDGRSIEKASLLGQPWIVDFIFTKCPGVCPLLTRRMKDLSEDLPADKLRLVSISVDPENDTPEALEAYAEKNGAGDNWLFLTGEQQEIARVVHDGFKLVYDPTPGENAAEAIVHSNRFVLVDAEGQIRGYYDAFNEADLATLRHDLQSLIGG